MQELDIKGYKDLRVAVTGGAGFIGSHLVERLLAYGARVTIVDNLLHGSKIEHLKKQEGLLIREGDLRDLEFLNNALSESEIAFHLAAVVGVEETQMMPLEVLDVEIGGTVNVLQAAKNNGLRRVVFASSSEVYGDSPTIMKEEGPFAPRSTYAVAKLTGEEYCKAFYQKYGLEYVCLRYFNVYGPRQDERFVIPRFVKTVVSGGQIKIHGDGNQKRDFTYIEDAINLSLLMGIRPEAKCHAFNIGTGTTTTINEVADLVAQAANGGSYHANPRYVAYDDKRPRDIEVFHRAADITKATSLLGYAPEVSLASGIKRYVLWYLDSFGGSSKEQDRTT